MTTALLWALVLVATVGLRTSYLRSWWTNVWVLENTHAQELTEKMGRDPPTQGVFSGP